MRYAWVVLLAACGPVADKINDVQFFEHSGGKKLIDARIVGKGDHWAWGKDELATTLTGRSLKDSNGTSRVDAMFDTQNGRVELIVFSRGDQ
ncbi:MAG TPA: hypothetical protein VHN14_02175 [Kofleriaceae bacterium]|jgi:hypothetical protein|nr:hypothetical protein [Kofleriaceae bacterium]